MDYKMSKKAQAVWEQIQAGALYVNYIDAMGSHAEYIRRADGSSEERLSRQIGCQMPIMRMYIVSQSHRQIVWAVKDSYAKK